MTDITAADNVMPMTVNGDPASMFAPPFLDDEEINILHPFANYIIGIYLGVIGMFSMLYPTNIPCAVYKKNVRRNMKCYII